MTYIVHVLLWNNGHPTTIIHFLHNRIATVWYDGCVCTAFSNTIRIIFFFIYETPWINWESCVFGKLFDLFIYEFEKSYERVVKNVRRRKINYLHKQRCKSLISHWRWWTMISRGKICKTKTDSVRFTCAINSKTVIRVLATRTRDGNSRYPRIIGLLWFSKCSILRFQMFWIKHFRVCLTVFRFESNRNIDTRASCNVTGSRILIFFKDPPPLGKTKDSLICTYLGVFMEGKPNPPVSHHCYFYFNTL